MPKKRTSRQRRAATELAAGAARREQHAQLVVQRRGDPRFPHRQTRPGGEVLLSFGTAHQDELRDLIEEQGRSFRERFGRDMGPDDPFVFDPEQDLPTALTENTITTEIIGLVEVAEQAGLDPAYIWAWAELGYIITEDNQHLFSANEVHTYLDAVARHQAEQHAAIGRNHHMERVRRLGPLSRRRSGRRWV